MQVNDFLANQCQQHAVAPYSYGYIQESSKREIRRATLKAVAIPGYQVPFSSYDMPIARGWGTGGLQLTLAMVGPQDTLKVIDQGADDSVNAVNMKRFVRAVTEVDTTDNTDEATLIQTRHRIPEEPLKEGQILIFQVPIPEPLRDVVHAETETRQLHAEGDYSAIWLRLYEDIVKYGEISIGARYPVMVNRRYLMDPSPIPRWDNPKLNNNEGLLLFGAGREKRVYAIPPHTEVKSLSFEDVPFRVEDFGDATCCESGASQVFLDEILSTKGETRWSCNDTNWKNKTIQGCAPERLRPDSSENEQ